MTIYTLNNNEVQMNDMSTETLKSFWLDMSAYGMIIILDHSKYYVIPWIEIFDRKLQWQCDCLK